MDKLSLEEEEEDDAKKTKIKTEEKKKKKKEKKCITITLTSRNKRKTITNVAGFEHSSSKSQDGNLKEVAKTLGKKFAYGCSVTKERRIKTRLIYKETMENRLRRF